MNIPPFLEKLLLSNEAVFKNASLGLTGANMVFVPNGKSAVILEVSIEPFINEVGAGFMSFITNGFQDNSNAAYITALRRIHYQLQIINDKYSTYINLNDALSMNVQTTFDSSGEPFKRVGAASLHFTGKRESLFIYTDRSMYFNLIYPYREQELGAPTTGITPTWSTPSGTFLPKIQTLPFTPITFNGSINEDYLAYAQVNTGGPNETYYSVGHQTDPAFSAELPQMEYLHLYNNVNHSSIQQPVPSATEYNFHDLFLIPFINVKYALLNARPDDYGLTKPGK